MSTRVEWTRLTRNIRDLFLAFRTSVGSALIRKKRTKVKSRRIQLVAVRNISAADPRFLAELERRKTIAILNSPRNQLR